MVEKSAAPNSLILSGRGFQTTSGCSFLDRLQLIGIILKLWCIAASRSIEPKERCHLPQMHPRVALAPALSLLSTIPSWSPSQPPLQSYSPAWIWVSVIHPNTALYFSVLTEFSLNTFIDLLFINEFIKIVSNYLPSKNLAVLIAQRDPRAL